MDGGAHLDRATRSVNSTGAFYISTEPRMNDFIITWDGHCTESYYGWRGAGV